MRAGRDDDIASVVSGNIRAEMARRGLRQVRIARLLGISQPQLSKRLSDDVSFSVAEAALIADFLGLSIEELLAPPPATVPGAAWTRDVQDAA